MNAGSAHAFERTDTTWAQVAFIRPADGTDNDECGIAVSLDDSGTTAFVGSTRP